MRLVADEEPAGKRRHSTDCACARIHFEEAGPAGIEDLARAAAGERQRMTLELESRRAEIARTLGADRSLRPRPKRARARAKIVRRCQIRHCRG
jgi:hypothetical protein